MNLDPVASNEICRSKSSIVANGSRAEIHIRSGKHRNEKKNQLFFENCNKLTVFQIEKPNTINIHSYSTVL